MLQLNVRKGRAISFLNPAHAAPEPLFAKDIILREIRFSVTVGDDLKRECRRVCRKASRLKGIICFILEFS